MSCVSVISKAGSNAFCLGGIREIDHGKALADGHLSAWLFLGLAGDAFPQTDAHGHGIQNESEDVAGDSVDDERASPDGFEDSFAEEEGEDDCEENGDDHGV